MNKTCSFLCNVVISIGRSCASTSDLLWRGSTHTHPSLQGSLEVCTVILTWSMSIKCLTGCVCNTNSGQLLCLQRNPGSHSAFSATVSACVEMFYQRCLLMFSTISMLLSAVMCVCVCFVEVISVSMTLGIDSGCWRRIMMVPASLSVCHP